MENGSWSATAVVSEIIPADMYRGSVTLQLYSGDPIYIAFGSDPVVGKGIRLSATFPLVVVSDHRAMLAIRVVCDAGQTASGGYATA